MDKKQFSENLRHLRLTKGYTQEQLAERLGISAQSVSRWECCITLPDVLQLPDLARIFGITVEDLFREGITCYPNYAQRLLAVYEVSGRTEDFASAEQEFLRLLTSEYTADDLRAFGTLYHHMMKNCANYALRYLDDAMSEGKQDKRLIGRIIQQKVALLCDMGRSSEVIEKYSQKIHSDPTDDQNWCFCIAAYHFAGENQTALELVKKALALFPDHSDLLFYAGDICKELGRHDDALRYWERVLQHDPSFLDALYSMGLCYEELAQYQKAYQIWDKLRNELLRHGMEQECAYVKKQIQFCEDKLCSLPVY